LHTIQKIVPLRTKSMYVMQKSPLYSKRMIKEISSGKTSRRKFLYNNAFT